MAESRRPPPVSPCVQIEGRGPVALALRLLLLRQGLRTASIRIDEPDTPPDWLGARALALSLGSLQILSRLSPDLHPAALLAPGGAAAPIRSVDVSRRGAVGGTLIHAEQLGVAALGAVIRYQALHDKLLAAHRAAPTPGDAAHPARDETSEHGAVLRVVADGSPGPESTVCDSGQHALVAEIQTRGSLPDCAFERFTPEGPLALLPLPEPGRRSLVWCAPEPQARARAALDPADFERALQEAFGPILGRLKLQGLRHVSPVPRRARGPLLGPATVAIGNAAQSLHPVAGQGLNLGLRDAFVLAQCLGDALSSGHPPTSVLERYARLREPDRRATIGVTDMLAGLTGLASTRPLQSALMAGIDTLPGARRALARGFMFGLRRL